MTGRPIPHDLDAEEALLGACMLSPAAVEAAVAAGVTAPDFYKPVHGEYFRAILNLIPYAPDPVSVAGALNGHGGPGALMELRRIQAATPASANAPAYARAVRDTARRRQLMLVAHELDTIAREGGDAAKILARASELTAGDIGTQRLAAGDVFTFDTPQLAPALWGTSEQMLWPAGEALWLCGPAGVGKTTVGTQLVAGRLGLIELLFDLPMAPAQRILYLACDRPSQIKRAFRRLFTEDQRSVLAERLVIWQGPPPRDFAKYPETLLAMARESKADTVIIDSLKDVALGISDDDVGAGLNSAVQLALAEGVEIAGMHHQRKGQAGQKPKTLEDVYGSTWITAGAGSVVLLWGAAGDPLIEVHHLKQPAAEVGPLKIEHDHNTGLTTVFRGMVDVLHVLRNSPHGVTSRDLAVLQTGKAEPTQNEITKAKRDLNKKVRDGLAHLTKGHRGGSGGTVSDRYHATTQHEPGEIF